jgi:hypothetical protein
MTFLIAVITTTSLFNIAILIWTVSVLHKIAKELRGESRWDPADPRMERR